MGTTPSDPTSDPDPDYGESLAQLCQAEMQHQPRRDGWSQIVAPMRQRGLWGLSERAESSCCEKVSYVRLPGRHALDEKF